MLVRDEVCGMEFEEAAAVARLTRGSVRYPGGRRTGVRAST